MCVGHIARLGHEFQFKNLKGGDNLADLRISGIIKLK
jgi:hypothetical protein